MNGETQSHESDASDHSDQLRPIRPSSPSEVPLTKECPGESNPVQPGRPSAIAAKLLFAWQPLTPKGIARFAGATFGRVLTVQFVFALFSASVVVWFLNRDWFPVVTQAIKQMPTDGDIRSGRLNWNGDSPDSLAENRFFALIVDLKHEGEARSPAHVAVEFGEQDFKIYSLLGYLEGRYPPQSWVGFNKTDATPWWGAWAPPILGIAAILVILSLMLCWAILATVYAGPAWLVGFFANRDLSLAASWRVSGVALMTGCVFMIAAIFIYGLGFLDLIQLGFAFVAHIIVGWIHVWLGIHKLPLHPEIAEVAGNPFTAAPPKPVEKMKETQ